MTLFRKATKHATKIRLAMIGPSGSGKTYTALTIAKHLGKRTAVIDTERGSASKYSDDFDFDVLELESFHPERYIEAMEAAAAEGYEVLVIDSLSHAWSGKDGLLEFVDNAAKRSRTNNTFGAWREATPLHNRLVDAMLTAPMHVLVTMRAKTEYVQEKDERTGKTSVRKVGMQPVQRDGLEYEFDVIADLDWDNNLIVSKSRVKGLQGYVVNRAGAEFAERLRVWAEAGAPAEEGPEPAAAASNGITGEQALALGAAVKKQELSKDQARAFFGWLFKREIGSVKELSAAEASRVIGWDDEAWQAALFDYAEATSGGPPEEAAA